MSRPREYIIYCDESVSKGSHFSNFYGGALIRSDHIDEVRQSVAEVKAKLNFHGEIKWSKISANYRQKYIDLVNHIFDLVEGGQIKFRIMFTQNMYRARNLTDEHWDNEYFILYYQFIKHAFGFLHHPLPKLGEPPINLRVYLDNIPHTDEKKQRFRAYICSLEKNPEFRAARIRVDPGNVTDVAAHEHDILQCLDLILGSMQFRLNDKHKEKPEGARRRGKRTIAKEAVYNQINLRIRGLRRGFNIGISTGDDGDKANRWHHPYRHWRFIPSDSEIVGTGKRKK